MTIVMQDLMKTRLIPMPEPQNERTNMMTYKADIVTKNNKGPIEYVELLMIFKLNKMPFHCKTTSKYSSGLCPSLFCIHDL